MPFPDRSSSTYRRVSSRIIWPAGGAFILVCYGFLVNLANGVNFGDESWFLQVISRVLSGDVLYRDVFVGVTPLSVYVTALVAAVLGTEILVVKGIVALCFAFTVILSWQIARQLTRCSARHWLITAALLVYAAPYPHAVYSPLAGVFFLAAFSAAVCWVNLAVGGTLHGTWRSAIYPIVGGLTAGLCFVTKQNIGVYALVAFLMSMTASGAGSTLMRRELFRSASITALGFALVCIVSLLPISFGGATNSFIDYGFLNKLTYLQKAGVGVSYLNQLAILPGFLYPPSWTGFRQFYSLAHFVLPLFVLGGLLIAGSKSNKGRGLTLTVLFFVAAAVLGAFPRVDVAHFVYATPELFVGIAYLWHRVKPVLSWRWTVGIPMIVILWIAFGLVQQISKIASVGTSADDFSKLPHFRAALIPADQSRVIEVHARALVEETSNSGPSFLLFPEAGFYYLITGLKNPTAFDYPFVTAFGLNGEEKTAAAIAQRKIRSVCLRSFDGFWSSLKPALLQDYVEKHLRPGKDIGLCTLYQSVR
jgi:hypothetical protein